SFAAPVTYTTFAVLLSHAFGDPAYRWKVDVADSQADMDARTGSFAEVVPFTGTLSDQFSTVTLSRLVSARLVPLTAPRVVGDNFVHIDEWQIPGRGPVNLLNGPRGLAAASNGTVYPTCSARSTTMDSSASSSIPIRCSPGRTRAGRSSTNRTRAPDSRA